MGNQQLGGKNVFATGHELESKTESITIQVGKILGTGDCLTLIDTPSVSNTQGKRHLYWATISHLLMCCKHEWQDARFAAFSPAQNFESALVLAYGYKSKKNGFNLR